MGHHDIEMQDKKMYCRGTLLRVPFKITKSRSLFTRRPAVEEDLLIKIKTLLRQESKYE